MGGKRGRLISLDDKQQALKLFDEAIKGGARRVKASEILNVSLRTLRRWQSQQNLNDKRQFNKQSPVNKLSAEEEQQILDIVNSNDYANLPPTKIVPLLVDKGSYIASESTIYRLLRKKGLLTHRRKEKPKKHSKPKEFLAHKPNQVWTWDITYLPTAVKGIFHYLYLIIDIYSRKIVGWSIHERESSEYASMLIHEACKTEKISPDQLTLHSDNGSPMKGATMLTTLYELGVLSSFSRPSVSNDNPYSESLFKTLKYCSLHPLTPFENITQARKWVLDFVEWYNNYHLHSSLKFITPAQRHQGLCVEIMNNRKNVYELAKMKRPERWTQNTRNWTLPEVVVLNPKGKRQNENKSNT